MLRHLKIIHASYVLYLSSRLDNFIFFHAKLLFQGSQLAFWSFFIDLQTSSNFSKTSFFSDWVPAVTSLTPAINSSFSFSEKSLNYQLDSHRNNTKPTGSTLCYMYLDIVIICRPVIKVKLPLIKIQLNLSTYRNRLRKDGAIPSRSLFLYFQKKIHMYPRLLKYSRILSGFSTMM